MTRKPKPRPRSGMHVTPRLILSVRDDQRARWQSAADRAGLNLSEWLRRVADAATK